MYGTESLIIQIICLSLYTTRKSFKAEQQATNSCSWLFILSTIMIWDGSSWLVWLEMNAHQSVSEPVLNRWQTHTERQTYARTARN